MEPISESPFLRNVGICLVIYLPIYAILQSFIKEAKRRSWILTAVCSVGCTVGSAPYALRLMRARFSIDNGIYSDEPLAQFLVTFLCMFLVLDLTVGSVAYPKQMDVMTGWVHHFCYISLCTWGLTCRFTVASATFLPIELPIMLMAFGRLNPKLRSDNLFGCTYFLARLLYMGLYMVSLACVKNPKHLIWPWTLPAMVMHIHWFAAWVRLLLRNQRKAATEALTAAALCGATAPAVKPDVSAVPDDPKIHAA